MYDGNGPVQPVRSVGDASYVVMANSHYVRPVGILVRFVNSTWLEPLEDPRKALSKS